MDWINHLQKGSNALGVAKESKPMGSAEKKAAISAEMDRLNQLPANAAKGSYATQRMRVLNKILQLMSMERTRTQDEELELLFAGLSL